MFLLGGVEKRRVLEVLKPHIFFDDQKGHLDPNILDTPLVHIPFGIANQWHSKLAILPVTSEMGAQAVIFQVATRKIAI